MYTIKQRREPSCVFVRLYGSDGLKHEQIFWDSRHDDSWESACQYSAGMGLAFRLTGIEYTFDV